MRGSNLLFLLFLVTSEVLAWKSRNVKFSETDLKVPLILWWSQDFFPHIDPRSADEVIEIQCSHNKDKKCLVTQNREHLKDAGSRLSVVMFYGSDFDAEDVPLPKKSNHMWALFNEESPQNNYMLCHNATAGVFNFSATYKRKSDYPLTTQHFPSVEYLIKRRPVDIADKNRFRKNGIAPVVYLQSHCDVPSDRDNYVHELMKHIPVDSYGSCLRNKDFENATLEHTKAMHDTELYNLLAKYKFHIAFENAICDDYITEKLTRPFHLGSVPIYRGSQWVRDYSPSENSVIVADDFNSPKDLAKYLNFLDKHDASYLKHLDFKSHKVLPNVYLREALESRAWSLDGYDEDHFVGGFECYVCDQAHQIQVERESGVEQPRVVEADHLSCPKPGPSHGTINDIPPNDHLHHWISDYWQQLDVARALNDIVSSSNHDSGSMFSVWDHIAKWYDEGKGALQHTEL